MYHLPLLPGYGPNSNIRSSVPSHIPGRKSLLSRLSEAEENGYQDTYFAAPESRSPTSLREGYMSSGSPVDTRRPPPRHHQSDYADAEDNGSKREQEDITREERPQTRKEDDVAEVVFFEYGVVVLYGLQEEQERELLEDLDKAGVIKRPIKEDDWEVEACHFAHDPNISYPRIYNDFFSESSLLLFFFYGTPDLTVDYHSLQISIPSSQALRSPCPRPVHPPSALRVLGPCGPLLTPHPLHPQAARNLWLPHARAA